MQDEPDPQSLLQLADPKSQVVTLSQDPSNDPTGTARELREAYGNVDVALVFIPGRAFDLTGTRHGRGRGWYDRFLRALPQSWWRIGVAKKKHMHQKRLLRQPWDEPMDWLLINDGDAWQMRRVSSEKIRMPRDTGPRTDQS